MQTEVFDSSDSEKSDDGLNALKEEAYINIFEDLTDIAILDICFEVHRAAKLGFFFVEDGKGVEKYGTEWRNTDIFGHMSSKMKFPLVNCPQCKCRLEATRFAPHLGKCMGMGRLSSRLANKKFANVDVLDSDDDYENGCDFVNSNKKRTKKKQGKNPRRVTKVRGKSREKTAAAESSAKYEEMTYAERKAFLDQMCGVVSKHTKRMCAKTLKCSQHSDEQKREIRDKLLGRGYMMDRLAGNTDHKDVDADNLDGDADHLDGDADNLDGDADNLDGDADHLVDDSDHLVDDAGHSVADANHSVDDADHSVADADHVVDDANHLVDDADHLGGDVQIDVDTVDGGYMTDLIVDDVQIDVDTVDEENGSLNFGDLTISRSPSPTENAPAAAAAAPVVAAAAAPVAAAAAAPQNFKKEEKKSSVTPRNTVAYLRKRKAELASNNSAGSSNQGPSAGSSSDAV